VAKHRQEEGYGSRTDPTQLLPVVKQPRRRLVSPLLLGAGGMAVALVLGVGGWALLGSRSNGDPLVFPWTGDKPGEINVSVSMVPTVQPVIPSRGPSPIAASQRGGLPRESPSPSSHAGVTAVPSSAASPSASPSRSAEGASVALSASIAKIWSWSDNILINVDVKNSGSAAATWTVELWFDKDVHANQPWNANVQVLSARHLKLTAVRTLGPGQTVQFGFIAGFSGWRIPALSTCAIEGQSFSCQEK